MTFFTLNCLQILLIPPKSIEIEALDLKYYHIESLRLYLEYKNAEKLLKRKIKYTIDDKNINNIVDKYINLFVQYISIILQYLNYNFDKVY